MTENPAETMRRAATRIRESVALVPPSPWFPAVHDVTTYDGLDVIASSGLTVRAQYVASWQPAVALAVADLLEARAEHHDMFDGINAVTWGYVDPALALARAYLGETETGHG